MFLCMSFRLDLHRLPYAGAGAAGLALTSSCSWLALGLLFVLAVALGLLFVLVVALGVLTMLAVALGLLFLLVVALGLLLCLL